MWKVFIEFNDKRELVRIVRPKLLEEIRKATEKDLSELFKSEVEQSFSIPLASFKTDIEALHLAIALHQSFNEVHKVVIRAYDIDGKGDGETICSLTRG